MATIYRCDRCHKEVKIAGELFTMRRIAVGDNVPMADMTHEICGSCAGQMIREWNESIPETRPHD